MAERRVLFACDLDSQVFGAVPLALAFKERGWRVTFAIDFKRKLSQSIQERLAGRFSLVKRAIGTLPTEDEAFRHEAIGVFVTGSQLALFRHTLDIAARVKKQPRPALFCGFNGLVFEKFEEGLAWRLGYDVIGLNGPRDRDTFTDFVDETDYAAQPSVIVGLRRRTDLTPHSLKPKIEAVQIEALEADAADAAPPLAPEPQPVAEPQPALASAETTAEARDSSDAIPIPTPDHGHLPVGDAPQGGELVAPALVDGALGDAPRLPTKRFVFAEQVVVPRLYDERFDLVKTLARLAAASPDWDVALKARVRPSEQTFHSQPIHISALARRLPEKPPNFRITYEPLDELLTGADMFATISSTALFDALDHDVPSLIATDFGLRNADGAHVFFASGLLTNLRELPSLDEAPRLTPHERWLDRMGYDTAFSPNALIDWLDAFDHTRPLPRPFVSFTTAINTASATAGSAAGVIRIWNDLNAHIPEGGFGPDADRSAAQAGLTRLGNAIVSSMVRPRFGSWRKGPTAVITRKIGLFWLYRRIRMKLGLTVE